MKSTEALTPTQIDRQIRDLSEQKRRLAQENYGYEFGDPKTPVSAKSKSTSIQIINWAFVVIGVAGIVGSFWSKFDMNKYTQFLQQYALIWAPLVVAVGGGRAVKNYVNKKYEAPVNINIPENEGK